MHNNGVSHDISNSDFEGVCILLKWLTYMPKKHGAPLPIMPPVDPIDREIDFYPTKTPYDPRHMLEGRPDPEDESVWQSGFFDRGSFHEVMNPWAQTVICGRARLVGIHIE